MASARRALFMETTRIAPEKTGGEITELLVRSGARQIGMDYSEHRKLVGIRFNLEVAPNRFRCFTLPIRSEPVFKIINGRRKHDWDREESAERDTMQAERVAWRQLYRWCQAQLALIETGMVEAAEVFLPYLQDSEGRTLFELMKASELKMLTE